MIIPDYICSHALLAIYEQLLLINENTVIGRSVAASLRTIHSEEELHALIINLKEYLHEAPFTFRKAVGDPLYFALCNYKND